MLTIISIIIIINEFDLGGTFARLLLDQHTMLPWSADRLFHKCPWHKRKWLSEQESFKFPPERYNWWRSYDCGVSDVENDEVTMSWCIRGPEVGVHLHFIGSRADKWIRHKIWRRRNCAMNDLRSFGAASYFHLHQIALTGDAGRCALAVGSTMGDSSTQHEFSIAACPTRSLRSSTNSTHPHLLHSRNKLAERAFYISGLTALHLWQLAKT